MISMRVKMYKLLLKTKSEINHVFEILIKINYFRFFY